MQGCNCGGLACVEKLKPASACRGGDAEAPYTTPPLETARAHNILENNRTTTTVYSSSYYL